MQSGNGRLHLGDASESGAKAAGELVAVGSVSLSLGSACLGGFGSPHGVGGRRLELLQASGDPAALG